MDLDKDVYRSPDFLLSTILNEWLTKENLREFHIEYPRLNSTVMQGLEGWIKYNHAFDGWSWIASIQTKGVYLDYEDAFLDASDPEFFDKLKSALRRHEATHSKCNHRRSLND